jgi:hypothetical protein
MPLRIGYLILTAAVMTGVSTALARQVVPPVGTIQNNTTVNNQMGMTLFLMKGTGEIQGNTVSPRVEVEYGTVVNGVYTPVAGSKKDAKVTIGNQGALTWDGGFYGPIAGGKTYKVTAKLYAAAGGNPPGKEQFCGENNLQFTLP